MTQEQDLMRYNVRGILAHLLSCEEHAEETGDEKIPHSWCIQGKHFLLARDHHAKELINHCSSVKGCSVKKYREFGEKMERTFKEEKPTLKNLRHLRNEFREIIKDDYPDLAIMETCGSVCDLDKLKPKNLYKSRNPNKSTHTHSELSGSGKNRNTPESDLYKENKRETLMAKFLNIDKPTAYKAVAILGGNIAGAAYVKYYVGTMIDNAITPNVIPLSGRASTWVDTLVIGLGGTIAGMKLSKGKNEKLGLALISFSTNVLANKLIDVADAATKGGLRMGGLRMSGLPSSRMAMPFSQPRLIQVD